MAMSCEAIDPPKRVAAALIDVLAGGGSAVGGRPDLQYDRIPIETIDGATLRRAEASLRSMLGGGFRATSNPPYLSAIDAGSQRLAERQRHALGAGRGRAPGSWTAGLRMTAPLGRSRASTVPLQPSQQAPTLPARW